MKLEFEGRFSYLDSVVTTPRSKSTSVMIRLSCNERGSLNAVERVADGAQGSEEAEDKGSDLMSRLLNPLG